MNKLGCILIILLVSCSKQYDDYRSPCSDLYAFNNPVKRKNLGILSFSDSSLHWVNYDTLQTMYFINSNKYKTSFVYHNSITVYNEQKLNERDSFVTSPCTKEYQIYNYGFNQKQYFNYKSQNLALNFSYIRQNVIDSTGTDSLSLLYGTDYFILGINNVFFDYPFNQKKAIPNWRQHDTLLLGTKIYYNVYESFVDPLKIDSNIINVTGAYYNISNGLLGFYLSNGENWWKE